VRRKVEVAMARFSVVGVMGEHQVETVSGLAVHAFLPVLRVDKKSYPMIAGALTSITTLSIHWASSRSC
jgi:hypothetical protein